MMREDGAVRSGFLGNLTDAQREALSEMQQQLSTPGDEQWLLRFLRYNDFEVAASLQQYQRMLAWREEQGCDQILQQWNPTACFASEEDLARFRSCHEQGYHHTDRYGRPLLIDRVGTAQAPLAPRSNP